MSWTIGIDIGSAQSKGVVIQDRKIMASCVMNSGGDFKLTSNVVRDKLLSFLGFSSSKIDYIVATGYGAKLINFANKVKPDILCHGKGVLFYSSSVRTVIDVGDLYSKAFKIDPNGNQSNFVLSGTCAGGSGRILRVIAKVLQVKVDEIGSLSLKSQKRINFHTNCAVFAESEAISRLAEGTKKEDLASGIHRALAAQIISLAERIGIEKDLAVVGGAAQDAGLIKAVEQQTALDIFVPEKPYLTGAIGAGIIAEESLKE